MRLAPFLCYAGVELANVNRVTTYGECSFFDMACPCPALDDEVYVDPVSDPAPWYDAAVPESADFKGFLPESITLSPPAILGSSDTQGRVIDVVGWLVSTTIEGMWFGEQWLTEALRGSRCRGCGGEDLEVLPFCREDDFPSGGPSVDFRTLVGVELVDGPRYTEVSDDPYSFVVSAQFQLRSSEDYLFGLADLVLDQAVDVSDGSICANLDAGEWSDAVSVITLEATTAATDVVVTGKRSADATCPGLGEPCFEVVVPSLPEGSVLTIDGTKREVRYYDPSSKSQVSGLPYLTLTKPVTYADVPPCGNVCVCTEVGTGTVQVGVTRYDRYL